MGKKYKLYGLSPKFKRGYCHETIVGSRHFRDNFADIKFVVRNIIS